MKSHLALVLLAALSFGGAAHAQFGPPNPDADGDGFVSASEQSTMSAKRFGRMDGNKDGVVDAAELARIKAMMGDRMPGGAGALTAMDADKDGKITRAEFDTLSKARFAKADTNRDGKLDQAERAAMRPQR